MLFECKVTNSVKMIKFIQFVSLKIKLRILINRQVSLEVVVHHQISCVGRSEFRHSLGEYSSLIFFSFFLFQLMAFFFFSSLFYI